LAKSKQTGKSYAIKSLNKRMLIAKYQVRKEDRGMGGGGSGWKRRGAGRGTGEMGGGWGVACDEWREDSGGSRRGVKGTRARA
jgi:hypothetical protein